MDDYLFDLPAFDQTKQQESVAGKKSLRQANRNQIKFTMGCLDELIPDNHRVRDVWEYVCKLDLSCFHKNIRVKSGSGGPGTADPRILLALWLYAILEGIISARHIDRLCKEHHAYIWICGGITMNYHTLSDFRTQNSSLFREILQESVALMWKSGTFQPDEVAQDGTRVKANAGFSLYKTEKTLGHYFKEANFYIEKLETELKENPNSITQREKSAKQRAIRERKERIEAAQEELKQYQEDRAKSCKKNHVAFTQTDKDKMRASIGDPECRKMKMGDGGFRLAYNVQFATSVHKKVILGVDVVNTLDPGTLEPMMQQVRENLKKVGCGMPKKWLADASYANKNDAQKAEESFPDTLLYSPPTGNGKVDALSPRKNDNKAMENLRKRMGTEEANVIYKQRGSTAEFSNATAKNRGMSEFLVRGLSKTKNMALIYAIVHNMGVYLSCFN